MPDAPSEQPNTTTLQRFRQWFFSKKNIEGTLSYNKVLIYLTLCISLVMIFWIIYLNASTINEHTLGILKPGAILQIALVSIIAGCIVKILIEVKQIMKFFINGIKLLTVIGMIVFYCAILIIPPLAMQPLSSFDYSTFIPFRTETSESVFIYYTIEELRTYALTLINNDRATFNLPPVELGDNKAAQLHVNDMFSNRFVSHWGTDGSKPYIRYSLNGGAGAVTENVAYTGYFTDVPNVAIIDAKNQIQILEHSMMYNDSSSNWGHRDNILNQWHNKVNIGIAYDEDHLTFVQDFEDDYITWTVPITYRNDRLTMEGINTLGTIQSVSLYYDPFPQNLTPQQLISSQYGGSYGLGELTGYIVPVSYFIEKVPYIHPYTWTINDDGSFSIEANIDTLLSKGNGVYTVVLWSKMNNVDVQLTTISLMIPNSL